MLPDALHGVDAGGEGCRVGEGEAVGKGEDVGGEGREGVLACGVGVGVRVDGAVPGAAVLVWEG
eukprot:7300524-Prymnesium_polylepis.1